VLESATFDDITSRCVGRRSAKSRWAALLLIGVVVLICVVVGWGVGEAASHFADDEAANAEHAFFKEAFEGLEEFGLLGGDFRLAGEVGGRSTTKNGEGNGDDQQLLIDLRAFHGR